MEMKLIIFLTFNTIQYMYSAITLYYYAYLYYSFLTGSLTSFLRANACLSLFSSRVHYKAHLILCQSELHPFMQRQERSPRTNIDHYADSDLSGQDTCSKYHSVLYISSGRL